MENNGPINASFIEPQNPKDPLDDKWIQAFKETHGKPPADSDRQDHLFSLIFAGRGDGGIWTNDDWSLYAKKKDKLWQGEEKWPGEGGKKNFDRFILHLERLAQLYEMTSIQAPKFARAVGLIWGGIAYDTPVSLALSRAAVGDHYRQLHEGTAGWLPHYVDDANPAHHWAASFLAGYNYGSVVSILASTTRDVAQYLTGLGGTMEDISLGIVAAKHGGKFRRNSRRSSKEKNPYSRLFINMRKDLSQ